MTEKWIVFWQLGDPIFSLLLKRNQEIKTSIGITFHISMNYSFYGDAFYSLTYQDIYWHLVWWSIPGFQYFETVFSGNHFLCRFTPNNWSLGFYSLFNFSCLTQQHDYLYSGYKPICQFHLFYRSRNSLSSRNKNGWHLLLMTGFCHALTGVCPIVIMEHTGNCCSSLAMGLICLSYDTDTSRLCKTTVHW